MTERANEPREPAWDPTPPVRPPLGVELTYRSEAALLVAYSTHLVKGQLPIETTTPFSTGTPLAIRLVAASTTINMAGVVAWSREEASRILKSTPVDCLVVNESIADLSASDVLDALEQRPVMRLLPVVFFGDKGDQQLAKWRSSEGAFALREARTIERLLDYVYFFVHRSTSSMSSADTL